MSALSHQFIKFNDFELDADGPALYYKGELVRDVEKKSLAVLAVLVQSPDTLVNHEEIIELVWGDNHQGVTPARVNQYVSKLQKLFARYEPELKFIENVRGRGYIFKGEISPQEAERSLLKLDEKPVLTQPAPPQSENETDRTSARPVGIPKRKSQEHIYLIAGLGLLSVVILSAWMIYRGDDAEDVKRVVKESQMYESLVLYKNPSSFKEGDLDRYWTTELDLNSNYDRARIRKSVENLRNEGTRYGDETKCEKFEFQSLDINAANDMAVVKTLEKWFIAVYGPDGKLIKNKNVGPYFVSYILRKIDGRWLIEKSNTARATPAAPKLISVEPKTEVASGKQFLVRIVGEDFLPEIVSIKVVGEDCPEANPCTVSNLALRKYAAMSSTTLESVPLTLTSGEFQLFAANGDSADSNPLPLEVH